MRHNTEEMHPMYLGWQIDWPVFVKVPFAAGSKNLTKGQEYKWAEMGVDPRKVAQMYGAGFLHHNPQLQKSNKTGDRLLEMKGEQLYSVVSQLNSELKKRTLSSKDYNEKRCRISKIDDKQRGLIRRWLNLNPWAAEFYYEVRDNILERGEKPVTQEVTED